MNKSQPDQSVRYAIYLAPKPQTPLWQFGSAVLGYDAESGLEVTGFRLPSMAEAQWNNATAQARTYGFHATLKAPFRLDEKYSEQDLVEKLGSFAAKQSMIAPVALSLSVVDDNKAGGFLALIPAEPYPYLRLLEAATVMDMDDFRAPLTPDELAKRKPGTLSERQKNYLADFGYPFILEDFRAHFTLSDRLPQAEKLAVELNDLMIGHIGSATITLDDLVLFKQPNSMARFQILARLPLGERAN